MLGNLFKESGVVRQLTETASNALMYIVVILLGTSVGASTSAEAFLNCDTLKIVVLGSVCLCFRYAQVSFSETDVQANRWKGQSADRFCGCICRSNGSTSISESGAEADPTNFLLMHAMGPNVAGVIGTAVAQPNIHGNLWVK